MRKTKIICTLGPAVDDEKILRELMVNGMNAARLNFSHGTHEEHKQRVDRFKKVRDSMKLPIPLLLDTKGPEIRIGKFASGEITLKKGQRFILTSEEIIGDETRTTVSYKDLYKDVKKHGRILLNDGLIELMVEEIKDQEIHCVVLNGGVLRNNQGVNVPDANINLPSLTPQDIKDIIFGIENDFDFIAASFVRKPEDVLNIRKVLEEYGGADLKIIAKIENRQGIDNFDEILKVADGIMVARGDLGVEIPVEEVPIVQKALIEKCYRYGKPVITATQMLDSMIRNPRPTRAEASDIANAIYDRTSAIMLSGETAIGKYPLESLIVMGKIAEKAEKAIDYWAAISQSKCGVMDSITDAISHATCTTAMDLNAAAIVAFTQSGHTARMISRFRPDCEIIAITPVVKVWRQLALSWGVSPFLVDEVFTADALFEIGERKALESGYVKNGDLIVITGGVPIGVSGTTNTMKVNIVGNHEAK
ncbi:MAG TPA: pyruvate kinase [Firmicutes bacterium]|uniref:Pyruvate kinase n=1 Tax=Capillibacterium thermochitinicola TaxID=2699427 RepID=A0A8J6LSL9_9FIRM|nr:pyruvate kinase [Capillibacterium thermochitinicola]HHW12252.1 pyruvate kinase [Bacillota bacterium]